MSEVKRDMKFVVSELNKILGKNYNLISFNALSPEDLLQVLSDVLMKIEQHGSRIDIRNETPEQSSIRIFSILRVLKYQPNKDPAVFRQGLVRGDADTIHPILSWLLSNMELVRQRAYLARFLVKVEIPVDYLGDPEINALYEQYLNLVEQFKSVHKEMEAGKKTGETAAELKADLQAMEKEKEIVMKRIEKMKLKAEPALHLLDIARALRLERDKERDFALQRDQEREAISVLQVSLQRVERELQIMRKNGEGVTSQILLQKLAEEVTVLSAVAKEKLPAEITVKKNHIKALTAVASSPYLGPDEIVNLRNQLDAITRQVQTLIETKISKHEMDKMEPFRQQASAITNMKRNILERLEQTTDDLEENQRKLEEKRAQSKMLIEDVVPKGEEYKKYISKLKVKNVAYRRCKTELDALKAENGVLRRTSVILEGMVTKLNKAGEVFTFVKENVPDNFSAENGYSMNVQLSRNISNLRTELGPLLNELKALRQKSSEIDERYAEAKKKHNAVADSTGSTVINLASETKKLKEKMQKVTEEKKKTLDEIAKMKRSEERIQQEIKSYTTSSSEPSMRDELNEALMQAEKKLKMLKEEEKTVKEVSAWNKKQMQQWQNIIEIFTCKLQCAEDSKQGDGIVVVGGGSETLILQ